MKFHGASISWGVASTIIGVNGFMQSRGHGVHADSALVKDGGETTVSKLYWDFNENASFTYVAMQPYVNSGTATVSHPNISDWVYITDYVYPAISGWWLCDDVSIMSGNTTATKVSLNLSRYPYVNMV